MDIEKIKQAKTKYIGKNVIYFNEIDSTQTEAKRNVEKYSNGTVIIADMQTAGRGTHGRVWHTKTDNIAMTIILKPEINIDKLEGFTVAIAENIRQSIKELYGIELEIKLPNDLLLNKKKICGILTEVVTIKEIVKEIFIGVGFNVNESDFSSDISNIATSLYKATKQVYCREDIICKILENIEQEEVMSFGDNNNDILMIKNAGLGIAMGHSNEQVKKVANFITKTNDEDGVAKALENIVL